MDAVVNINNAQASVAQWADLHELSLGAAKQEMVDGAIRLRWDNTSNRPQSAPRGANHRAYGGRSAGPHEYADPAGNSAPFLAVL